MDLIDFRNYVLAQREASKAEALSVLTAKLDEVKKGQKNG